MCNFKLRNRLSTIIKAYFKLLFIWKLYPFGSSKYFLIQNYSEGKKVRLTGSMLPSPTQERYSENYSPCVIYGRQIESYDLSSIFYVETTYFINLLYRFAFRSIKPVNSNDWCITKLLLIFLMINYL